MSFRNPTPVQIGMSGEFFGKTYRVAGRVVMSAEYEGATYYWNEFNLENSEGESATLVYEETERGGEWRWFTMFEPECPMTAEDAATKRVGDPLNLDGGDVRVTLVDESRVCHIEGTAPEGVEVGDVARYFNAEAGKTMYVVSWTGEEVECYRGETIPGATVKSAFGLTTAALSGFALAVTAPFKSSQFPTKLVALLVGLIVLAVFLLSRSSGRPPAPVKVAAAPVSLAVGSAGRLNGTNYRVAAHFLVAITEVNLRFDRHEFLLRDADGKEAWLIQGWKPGGKDWHLFAPLHPVAPLTPQRAGSIRWGETVNVDGYVAPVTELFRANILQATDSDLPAMKAGGVFFGFVGQRDSLLLLARWNEDSITCLKGDPLTAHEVVAAFGPSAEK
jgi:hypothetical protein